MGGHQTHQRALAPLVVQLYLPMLPLTLFLKLNEHMGQWMTAATKTLLCMHLGIETIGKTDYMILGFCISGWS
jgi:hypothetical protein